MGCGREINKKKQDELGVEGAESKTQSQEEMVSCRKMEPGRFQPAVGISLPDRGRQSRESSRKGTRHD